MTVLQFLEVYIGSEEQADASEKNESKEKVLAFINGDEDAASYFFTKYSEHRYNFILKNIGDKDDALHRATHNGWKHTGLPWVQE